MLSYKKNVLISEDENITIEEYFEKQSFCRHTHEFFELVYVRKGECTHYINDIEYKTHHGDLVFINPGQVHSFEIKTSVIMVNILINPEFISSELMDTENIITLFRHSMFAEFENIDCVPSQCVHFEGAELAELDSLIGMLVNEYKQKNCGYKSIIHGGIRILFTKLLRRMQPGSSQSMNKADDLLQGIIGYIDENYNRKISLKEIAANTFYNPAYFGKVLKDYCGKSFSSYLKEKRVAKAAALLKNTKMSVDDIMLEAGYSDKKLFYRHFKEIYNTTPAKYRKL